MAAYKSCMACMVVKIGFYQGGHKELRRINPLSPESDQHQISPCNINAL